MQLLSNVIAMSIFCNPRIWLWLNTNIFSISNLEVMHTDTIINIDTTITFWINVRFSCCILKTQYMIKTTKNWVGNIFNEYHRLKSNTYNDRIFTITLLNLFCNFVPCSQSCLKRFNSNLTCVLICIMLFPCLWIPS